MTQEGVFWLKDYTQWLKYHRSFHHPCNSSKADSSHDLCWQTPKCNLYFIKTEYFLIQPGLVSSWVFWGNSWRVWPIAYCEGSHLVCLQQLLLQFEKVSHVPGYKLTEWIARPFFSNSCSCLDWWHYCPYPCFLEGTTVCVEVTASGGVWALCGFVQQIAADICWLFFCIQKIK